MSEQDDTGVLNWSELGVSGLLPTGTVTLLLADVESSTRLWETQPDEMTAAFARLDDARSNLIAAHGGMRPVEQGEGDSFVVAFARASDAVSCALDLQRAALAPIRLRIGIHTGEVQLRDEGNYIGPTINRTARLRDLGHGGQTLLSGVTEALVVDMLPPATWLTDMGAYELRGVPRPERVVQLCHPDLCNEFPPLRTVNNIAVQRLPNSLTSFVGRTAELAQVHGILSENRLVTLTGAGGAGKTRLAIEIASRLAGDIGDGVWCVDLAPITDPDLVPVTMARALGLPDQPGRSTIDTLTRVVAERQMLVVLDNCEHLLDAVAALVKSLLAASARLSLLTTSREPIGVPGEVSWRVPSLSLADEAIDLFTDRARLARPDFVATEENSAVVAEICARLDGLPLAIELAAARVRALSLNEILHSLHDRFRLLTGGARTAVRRQQTLRASVDWSHALLTEPERVLFRRLAVFQGGFDLDGAQSVCGGGDIERYHVLDQLTLLIDKSLVVADDSGGRTRYRLLETVRQYALEKLGESGEAGDVRSRHRDHYTALAAVLDAPAVDNHEQRIKDTNIEIDNLRAAFGWSCENSDTALALALASSLQPLWHPRRIREGLAWFNTALIELDAEHPDTTPALRARALADRAMLGILAGSAGCLDWAQEALVLAREVDDAALLVRALAACGYIASYFDAEAARAYFAEAIGPARELGDPWRLAPILAAQAFAAGAAGNPLASRAAAEEGRDLADAIGDRLDARRCRVYLGRAQLYQGELASAAAQFAAAVDEAEAPVDEFFRTDSRAMLGWALACQGDTSAARAAAESAVEAAADVGGVLAGLAYWALAATALAAGDIDTALDATEAAGPHMNASPQTAAVGCLYKAQAALARGDLAAASRWADDAASTVTGVFLSEALMARSRVAITQGDPEQAYRDAHDALAEAAAVGAYVVVPDILECLGTLAGEGDSYQESARLLGAAKVIRQRMGSVRFEIYDASFEASVVAVQDALGESAFEAALAEGAALSTEEAIAYARRGRGQRKRPTSGWGALTPTELDVVKLLSEGLANNDIATRLFISPRTVQTHLTHVYTKLGLSSRVQLAQAAARHT